MKVKKLEEVDEDLFLEDTLVLGQNLLVEDLLIEQNKSKVEK